ncbi:hypothetical protein BofuT4_P046590.1 [Botrytis cinerea T4]|uniref:Uncharacterized protein n=1 Tax=Botryotinia fuckeliana (strain T4) TaxID=999810 RepID=G2XYV4_BOTF4|nr:hypothetical protein BofuT4_P046590.1 [Botrytis cinerea T4]
MDTCVYGVASQANAVSGFWLCELCELVVVLFTSPVAGPDLKKVSRVLLGLASNKKMNNVPTYQGD